MEREIEQRPGVVPTEEERARLIGELVQEFVVGLGRDRAMTPAGVVKIERAQRKAANDVGENANPPSPIDVGGIRGNCPDPRCQVRVDAAGGLSTEPPSRILPLAAAVDVGCRKSGEGIRMEMPLPVREGGVSGRGARRAGGRGETGIHAAACAGINSAGSTFTPCCRDAASTCCMAVAGIRPVVRQYWITDGGRPIFSAASRTVPKRDKTDAIWLMAR